MINFNDKISFIWKIAELLRGPYKPEKHGEKDYINCNYPIE